MLSSIGPAGLAVGAGLGIAGGAAAFLVGDFAELAERAKVMRESFERMAESRGSNPAQLMEEISEATRGTLDQIKSLTIANTALSSGIEQLDKNLGQIIRDTRSVSTALGRNASEDIERVISAINKQEQELLDELGIVARAATAYKAYAEQLGTTASKLTDLQKRTAFANLVIGQLREKAEAVGDPINRTAEASERFGSAWVDLKITLGSMVETGGVLDQLASGIEAVNEAIGNTQFRGGSGARFLPAPPAGTPDPADVGLFPASTPRAPESGDSLRVAKRLVELGEQEVSQNAAVIDALSINTQRVQFVGSPHGEPPASGQNLPSLADVAALFDGLRSDVPEIRDQLDEFSNETLRNFEAETILAKKRREIRFAEITDSDELARASLRWRQIQLETQLFVTNGSKEQFAVLEQLHAEEMGLLEAKQMGAKDEEDAERRLAEKRALVNDVSGETVRILGRLAPEMQSFSQAIVDLSRGDYVGAVSNSIHGLLDVLGVARSEELERLRAIEQVTRSIRQQTRTIQDSLLGADEGLALELRSLQSRASQPLLDYFNSVVAHAETSAQRLDLAEIAMEDLVKTLDALEYNANRGKLGLENFSIGAQHVFSEIGLSPKELFDSLTSAFSPDQLKDIAFRIFDVRDALDEAGDSADKVVAGFDPLSRQLRTQFDFAEIQLRSQAQRRFQSEGADTIGQNRVLKDLESQLSAVSSAEVAMRRRLQRAGVADQGGSTRHDDLAKVTASADESAAAVPVGISLTALSVSDFEEMIQLPDASRRIEIAWEDAVHINDKYGVNGRRPEHWDDIVRVPGRDARVTVNWENAVHIKDKYGVGGNRPQGWADVVSRSKIDEMTSIEKKWSDAITIARSNLSDYGVRQWSDIVRLERASQSIGGSYSHTPGLSRHHRSWAQVIDLRPADLSDYGVNRWSQMVLLSRESGGLSKHVRSFADLVDIRPTTLSMSSMIRLQPVRVTAAQLIKVAGRLKLSDLIDLSDLDKRIDSRVAKRNDKARYRDDPIGFAAGQ